MKVRLTKYRKGCTGFSEISILLVFLKVRLTKCRKGHQMWVKVTEGSSNIEILEFARLSQRQAPETGSGPAAQTHPSTRAGGQDDMSSNKLPQTKHIGEQAGVGTLVAVFEFFEGVCLSHVILSPGACGRMVPSRGSCHLIRRIRWIRWIRG